MNTLSELGGKDEIGIMKVFVAPTLLIWIFKPLQEKIVFAQSIPDWLSFKFTKISLGVTKLVGRVTAIVGEIISLKIFTPKAKTPRQLTQPLCTESA